ncbi:hypothetical protein M0813_18523 [Anaeramoeba flamelloides]|uniref:BTB domain-containing protein n=1 Tax=Anaeramoeba flamelloides TaxID=1746091 RepID=A0ABQ8YSL2_9EUKA|nr:hypothetical protein M0813_18523 [Anaeramoeba flamelloides]
MTNSSSLYLTGPRNDFSFVAQKKKNNLPKWTESNLKKTQTIKKIVSGYDLHFLVWKKPNKLEFYEKYKEKRKYQLPKNETIKDIVSSSDTYQILTESGKVWSLANKYYFKEVPLLDADQSTFEEIRPVTFFEENKLFVNSLIMGSVSGYYLCNGDQLYASGSNSEGRLGIGKKGGQEPMPVYVQDKVTKIFAGSLSEVFFLITSQPDLLYCCGNNSYGQLGIGSSRLKKSPTVVKNFKGSEILTISSCHFHSILINKKGQTFSCGYQETNGHSFQKNTFTLILQLKKKKVIQLATGSHQTFVLTDQNELYGWGFEKGLFPTNESTYNKFPTKIMLPGLFTNYLDSKDMIRISCGARVSFLYLDFKNTLSEDLRILYETKKFCDCEIGTMGNQIPVHKSLVECRTKLTIDQIQNKLFVEKPINKEQTLSFLKWIYSDDISEIGKLEQTFNLLELTFPPSVDNTLEKDIAQLYQDEDSKDFKILVKIDGDNQDEEEEDDLDEDKEENYEEISVHKFILYARSGLFRAMFDYVNEKDNTNQVQDYTNKSIKSLEILIKYFYTNSIEMTTEQDPKLIVDELSDAVEYYQLNNQYIVSSSYTYLILTESGKVWSLSNKTNSNSFKEVPLLDADQSNFEEIRYVTFFEEKKLFVNSLAMGCSSGYYLCNGDQLYFSGSNGEGSLGIGQYIRQEPMPVYVQDKVIKIFAGNSAFSFFSSQSSLIFYIPVEEQFWTGQTFGCGNEDYTGHGVRKKHFYLNTTTQGEESCPTENRILRTLVLTDQNELYMWGFEGYYNYPTNQYYKNKVPTKISLPGFLSKYLDSKDMIQIVSGSKQYLSLVECRTKLTIDQIQNKLFGEKPINKEQTLSFLKWIYSDDISEIGKLEQTFNLLELTFPPSVDNTLEKDIAQLYKDEDSKDFKILVNIDDQDEEEENKEEEDEDKEDNYEEIPVHKFILLARSGLFRAMFDYVNEKDNTNTVLCLFKAQKKSRNKAQKYLIKAQNQIGQNKAQFFCVIAKITHM